MSGHAMLNLTLLEGMVSFGTDIRMTFSKGQYYIDLCVDGDPRWSGEGGSFAVALRVLEQRIRADEKGLRAQADVRNEIATVIGAGVPEQGEGPPEETAPPATEAEGKEVTP